MELVHSGDMNCTGGQAVINYLSARDDLSRKGIMARASSDLFTPAEAAAVAEVPMKAVYKTVAERLPKSSLIQRSGQTYLTAQAVICVRLDYELPKGCTRRSSPFRLRETQRE